MEEGLTNIWLHRISHEGEISRPLLDNGFLSIGWSDLSSREFLNEIRVGGDYGWKRMEEKFKEVYEHISTNRYSFWRFTVDMKRGDWIIVPGPGNFGIYEALGEAVPVSEIPLPAGFKARNGSPTAIRDGLLQADCYDHPYDLGYAIPVKEIAANISRWDYADADLTKIMKVRQTNLDITDLKKSVEKALKAFKEGKPLNLYSELLEEVRPVILNKILEIHHADKLEELVREYFQNLGASSVILSKNEAGKKGDADIAATFERLKLIIYVQVKSHTGVTDSWALEQIKEYGEYRSALDGDYDSVLWVISTCDKFSGEAVALASEYGVRLIDGQGFAKMLFDAGFAGFDI